MWRAVTVENNELALEEDIAEDGEADTRVGLDPAEASGAGAIGGGVVDVRAGDGGLVAANGEADVRKSGAAGVSVAALLLVILSAVDTAVVVRDDIIVDEEESGSGVGDGVADSASIGVADSVAVSGEAPEALAVVHVNIRDVASVGGVVDGAEGVSARLALLEIGSE